MSESTEKNTSESTKEEIINAHKEAHLISKYGTIEEQVPRPKSNEIKVLSPQLKQFIKNETDYSLRKETFTLFGEEKTDYFAPKEGLENFDRPQATVTPAANTDDPVIIHYTTDIA